MKMSTIEWSQLLHRLRNNDPSLTSLSLRGQKIQNKGLDELCEALQFNSALTSLDLYNNDIKSADSLAKLSEVLQSEKCRLHSLDLGCNQVDDAGVRNLSEALQFGCKLVVLNLDSNKVGDEGAKSLAWTLRLNRTLTFLSISQNKIGDEGAEALTKTFKENRTLAGLYIELNEIGQSALEEIRKVVELNREWADRLHDAIKVRDLPSVKALVEGGGRVSLLAADRQGNTSLHLAVSFGDKELFSYLLGIFYCRHLPLTLKNSDSKTVEDLVQGTPLADEFLRQQPSVKPLQPISSPSVIAPWKNQLQLLLDEADDFYARGKGHFKENLSEAIGFFQRAKDKYKAAKERSPNAAIDAFTSKKIDKRLGKLSEEGKYAANTLNALRK